ncbi:GrpB family protein [Rhizobium oryzicola]|uniref:GrpB family protein n=1 Tax=Rhizobium oryzicola TaxID=1232668 RepID=A0ABT8SSY6_9HYPH|nr:GrpB family protein [Rhizobium oryzicola]MDO1581519.1 GrpB family protein [Rhizobium oryzicola]
MKPPIVLEPPNPRWAALFETERLAMENVNEGWFSAIHHIGSTSIPGIVAKPIIDILVALNRDEDGAACAAAMETIGYEYRGDGGISGRRYYRKGNPHTHHVHMFVESHPAYGRHLRFRDFLRAHPEDARAYEALKQELAVRFVSDTFSYSQAKDEFCQRIARLAKQGANGFHE